LKLRFGWGKTGNQKIGKYNAYTTYRSDIYHAGYPIDGNQVTPTIGYDASAFGNPNAKWESTTSTNIGLDAALLGSKLTFELDIWNRKTTDMLFTTPITFTAGDATAPAFNVGEMTNKGIDFGINYKNSVGDFRYGIGANFSTYRNNVDKLDASPNTRYLGYSSRVPAVTVTQAGLPISSFYGYKVLGIFSLMMKLKLGQLMVTIIRQVNSRLQILMAMVKSRRMTVLLLVIHTRTLRMD
jgi:outer membrane receptor protein involved in Fe transport